MAIPFFLLTLLGTLEILVVTSGFIFDRLFKKKKRSLPTSPSQSLAIIIPAHNEENHIVKTIQSIQCSAEKGSNISIYVVADNCRDQTPLLAEQAGATVLKRDDTEKIGKGHALHFAFNKLLKKGYHYFFVIDADTVVGQNLIPTLYNTFLEGEEAVQVRYNFLPADQSLKSDLQILGISAFNTLRPIGRNFFGFSSGILGNGFGLTRKVIQEIPYTAHSIVEDLEYHHQLLEKGFRVKFIESTYVASSLPGSEEGKETQRARWEGGRFQILRKSGPQLLKQVFIERKLHLVEPMLELFCLPLSYHLILLTPTLFSSFQWIKGYGIFSFALIGVNLATACTIGSFWKNLKALSSAPLYLIWKLLLIPKIAVNATKQAVWIRTDRK